MVWFKEAPLKPSFLLDELSKTGRTGEGLHTATTIPTNC
jgi:hypothetical protein